MKKNPKDEGSKRETRRIFYSRFNFAFNTFFFLFQSHQFVEWKLIYEDEQQVRLSPYIC